MASSRIVVLDPNIAVEDVPGQQAFVACVLARSGQRFKPAVAQTTSQEIPCGNLTYTCRRIRQVRALPSA